MLQPLLFCYTESIDAQIYGHHLQQTWIQWRFHKWLLVFAQVFFRTTCAEFTKWVCVSPIFCVSSLRCWDTSLKPQKQKINLIVFSFIWGTGVLNLFMHLSDANELCPLEFFYVASHKLPLETQSNVVQSGGCFRKDLNKLLNWSKHMTTVVVVLVSSVCRLVHWSRIVQQTKEIDFIFLNLDMFSRGGPNLQGSKSAPQSCHYHFLLSLVSPSPVFQSDPQSTLKF